MFIITLLIKHKQEKFYNSATSSLSSTSVAVEMSKMASQTVGNSVSEFLSGFSDTKTDSAARVSFKVSFPCCTKWCIGNSKYLPWVCSSLMKLSWTMLCSASVWVHEGSLWRTILLCEWFPSAWGWLAYRLQHMDQHPGPPYFPEWRTNRDVYFDVM